MDVLRQSVLAANARKRPRTSSRAEQPRDSSAMTFRPVQRAEKLIQNEGVESKGLARALSVRSTKRRLVPRNPHQIDTSWASLDFRDCCGCGAQILWQFG